MAEIDELKARLLRIEADVAFLRARLMATAEDAADEAGAGPSVAPEPPPIPTDDEIEVDSVVLDGSTPSGGSKRRTDKSLEWAANEIAVLRLFGWAGSSAQSFPLVRMSDESTGETIRLDGIHFLVRAPVDPSDPSKGAELKYVKLVRIEADSCEDSSSSSSS